MQILLTQTEIMSQMRALMGQQLTEAVSGISTNQNRAFIAASYLKALADSTWVSTEGRVTVDLGNEQYQIAYPTNAGVGSIVELALCESADGQYREMESRLLPAHVDFDVIESLGGDEFAAILGEPLYWQQRGDFIYLWPPNDDTARKVRIRFNKVRRFQTDGESSLCDGQLILYWAVAMSYGAAGDLQQQAFYQGLYQDRLGILRAWQHTGETITYRDDSPVLDYQNVQRPVPNWDTRPRT